MKKKYPQNNIPNHSRVKNLNGLEFGLLSVTSFNSINETGHALWNCHCNKCGNSCVINSQHLLAGVTQTCGCRDYILDESYFEYPNIENSYWAGFIAADGNVRQDKSNLRISLHKKDKGHLLKFAKSISEVGKVKDLDTINQVYFGVGSAKICLDLEKNFNITPNKSLTLVPPVLKDNRFTNAFISGYIDGDGSIGVDRGGKFFFDVAGTYEMLAYIKQFIFLFSEKPMKMAIRNRGNYFSMGGGGSRIRAALYNFMGYVSVPRMERKWNNV